MTNTSENLMKQAMDSAYGWAAVLTKWDRVMIFSEFLKF